MPRALLLLLLAGAVAGAWFLLGPSLLGQGPADDGAGLVAPPAPSRGDPAEPPAEPPPFEPPSRVAQPPSAPERVGVVGPDDRSLPPLGDGPWQAARLTLKPAPGGAVTGAEALAALGERFYVRTRDAQELEALRAERLGQGAPPGPVPAQALLGRLEARGWKVEVRDPLLLVSRGPGGGTPSGPDRPR